MQSIFGILVLNHGEKGYKTHHTGFTRNIGEHKAVCLLTQGLSARDAIERLCLLTAALSMVSQWITQYWIWRMKSATLEIYWVQIEAVCRQLLHGAMLPGVSLRNFSPSSPPDTFHFQYEVRYSLSVCAQLFSSVVRLWHPPRLTYSICPAMIGPRSTVWLVWG